MAFIWPKFRYAIVLVIALGTLVLHHPIGADDLLSDLDDSDEIGLLSTPSHKGGRELKTLPEIEAPHNTPSLPKPSPKPDVYTVNFNNMEMIEYVRFVSKISGLNFIFDEKDLQFKVTIVSEEPTTPKNILSILMQVLRIHDLTLLEQDNNLLITSAKTVNQIPTLVSTDLPMAPKGNIPIVTRVFRIKNANLATIANIIKPMMSASALIETSTETRQLIVSDITTNVDKISSLLASLDTPHTPLEIDSYVTKHILPTELVTMATQILTPFAEGNPLIFVPQSETNSIFIVSTPYLIERAMSVLEDLDTPISGIQQVVANENIFLYKIQIRSADFLKQALYQVARELKDRGAPPKLVNTIENVKWIKDTNSLLFIGDTDNLKKVQDILANFDSLEAGGSSTFFLYKLKNAQGDAIDASLKKMAKDLKQSGVPNEALIHAIDSIRWVKENNSLFITGSGPAIEQTKVLIAEFDVPGVLSAIETKSSFYIYEPAYRDAKEVMKALDDIARSMKASGLVDPELLLTISSARYIESTKSFLFTGPPEAIVKLKDLMAQIETVATSPRGGDFFIYKPIYRDAKSIMKSLEDIGRDMKASGLVNRDLLLALGSAHFIESTHSLLFTGPQESLTRVKELLTEIDIASAGESATRGAPAAFVVYQPQHVTPEQLMTSLREVQRNLQAAGSTDRDVIKILNTMKWVKENDAVLFTGPEAALKSVEELAKQFDSTSMGIAAHPAEIFILYTPRFLTGDDLVSVLQEFKQNAVGAGVDDKQLFHTIDNLKWIPKTCSLLIAGDQQSVAKVEDLLKRFDVQPKTDMGGPDIQTIENTGFLIYKLQYHQGNEILSALKQISVDIAKGTNTASESLLSAINSLQWIKVTNSLLGTGDEQTLTKLKTLIQNMDVPLRQVFIEVLVIETSMTNTQNFGLQWGGKMQFMNKFTGSTGNFPLSQPNSTTASTNATTVGNGISPALNAITATTTPTPSVGTVGTPGQAIPFMTGFDLGVIGDIIMHKGRSFISLGSLVNALQTDTDSTILLNPKIVAQDSNNATIFVGTNLPFIGSFVNNISQSTVQTSNLEYRDIGVNLSITPTLGSGEIVTLDINNDISEVIGTTSFGNSTQSNQVTGIQTSHTSMNTRVHVPNKHFVALSGMIQDNKTHFKSGFPCLGGLPIVGFLFSENDRLNSKNNVIMFVRPHIINTFEEYKQLTEQQEALYKEQAGLDILREQFDAGIDMVKTPENE